MKCLPALASFNSTSGMSRGNSTTHARSKSSFAIRSSTFGVDVGIRVVLLRLVEVRRIVQLAVGDHVHSLQSAEVVDQPGLRVVEAAGVAHAESDMHGF